MNSAANLSATVARDEIARGTLTAQMLVEACHQRVFEREPDIQAWASLDCATSRQAAHASDQAQAVAGVLKGIPIGVKDVIATADYPTRYNSPIYEHCRATVDAACVTLLRQAGAIIFGKTATVEFAATGRAPATRNPRDVTRTPGGSSSGSAAAVADCHVPLTIGTQTGGSIIRPASFCGVYAIKPTWGIINRDGAKTFAPSLDTIGWFSRSADDLMLLYNVFDPEAGVWPEISLDGTSIALCRTPWWHLTDRSVKSAFASAESRLRAVGVDVHILELPPHFESLLHWQNVIMRKEAQASFAAEFRTSPELLHQDIYDQANSGCGFTRQDLLAAYDGAARCRAEFDDMTRDFTAVMTPSSCSEAPSLSGGTGSLAMNAAWSLLHVPCINVPGLKGASGLPVGLTMTGPRFADRRLLAAARAVGELLA